MLHEATQDDVARCRMAKITFAWEQPLDDRQAKDVQRILVDQALPGARSMRRAVLAQ